VTRGHAELRPLRKTGHDNVIFAAVRTSPEAAGATLVISMSLLTTHVEAAHNGAACATDPATTTKVAIAAPAMAPLAKRMVVLI
jgi:hypothetical protein